MEALSSFVGSDMADVDRYVLKQGSTMASEESKTGHVLPHQRPARVFSNHRCHIVTVDI